MAKAKEGFAAALLEDLAQRGEVEVDEAGLHEHRPDGFYATADPLIGAGEGIEDRLVLGAFLEEHVVGQRNNSVADFAQCEQAFFGLF